MALLKTKFGIWLRRAVCVGGGGVFAAMLIFFCRVVDRPFSGTIDEQMRMIARDWPVAVALGAALGALIVFWTERAERAEGNRR